VRSATIDVLTAGDVDRFWRGLSVLPLVESAGDGQSVVTFCWRDPSAADVLLFANRLTDETSLSDTMLERLPGCDLWHASFLMDDDWRASYSFLVRRHGEAAPWEVDGQVALRAALDRGHPDPLNPATCRNRAGVVQSVVSLPDAPPQPWLTPRPDVPAGRVTEVTGPDGRPVWLYDPAGLDPGAALPLLVALDGEVWVSTQSLPTVLDNLIADAAVPPVRAVLPASGGRDARWAELGSGAGGVGFVVDELVPWAATVREVARDRVVVAGQSLGGLTALRCGLLRPEAVSGVVSESASLWQDPLIDAIGSVSGCRPRIHLAWGAQEWVLAPPHEALARRLEAEGWTVREAVHNGGHDYAWWRGDLADGLRWVLG